MTYFTVDEVAEQLRVSRATIMRLISQGKFPGIQVGSQWRIPEDELDAYLKRDSKWTGQTNGTSDSMSETQGHG